MNVLIVDNHDSFTYNLVQQLRELGAEPVVRQIEKVNVKELKTYRKVLVSPGPGLPSYNLKRLIKQAASGCSVLGVCLGHQAAGEVYGGRLKRASRIYHGEAVNTLIKVRGYSLFNGLPDIFSAGRYHSWIVERESLPDILEITAEDENGEIMGLRHKTMDLHSVQFHPESILTPQGSLIISNWLMM